MKERYDVVVIGGGCIGVSVAAHLAEMGCRDVVILEKERFLGTGATGKCAGGVRVQFSTPVNIQMSKYSIDEFEIMDQSDGVGLVQCGYLFLMSKDLHKKIYDRNRELQRSYGADVRFVEKNDIESLVPNVDVSRIIGGNFCPTDGLVDPGMLVESYRKKARNLDVDIELETEVTGIQVENGKVNMVETSKGSVKTGLVINAAGPFAGAVGEMAGLEIPIGPVRRMITTTGTLDFVTDKFPMTVDIETGLYMHKEGNGLLIGMANKAEKPGFDESVDEAFLDEMLMAALDVMPALGEAEIKTRYPGTWAGLYEVTPDHHSIIGPHPDAEGFFIVAGFSGHGLMHAPAAGKAVAEAVVAGKSKTLDIHPLRFERFAEGDLVEEKNVI